LSNDVPFPSPNNSKTFDQTIREAQRSVLCEIVVSLADESLLSQYRLSILEKSRANLENIRIEIERVKRENTVKEGIRREDMDIVKIEVPDEIKREVISHNFPTRTKSPSNNTNILCMACKAACLKTTIRDNINLTNPTFLSNHDTFDQNHNCQTCNHSVSMHIYTLQDYTPSPMSIPSPVYSIPTRIPTYTIREHTNISIHSNTPTTLSAVRACMHQWILWTDQWTHIIRADIDRNDIEIKYCSNRVSSNSTMLAYLCHVLSSMGVGMDCFEYYISVGKIDGEMENACKRKIIEAYKEKKAILESNPHFYPISLSPLTKDYLKELMISTQRDQQSQNAILSNSSKHPLNPFLK